MLQLIIIPLTLVNIKINPGFNYKRGETYWTTVGRYTIIDPRGV
jgi:hypothetical protein